MVNETTKITGDFFDEDYFESHTKSNYGSYCDFPFFKDCAQYFWKRFLPRDSIEIGCAKGFIVKWLNRLGVDAFGVDISEYAIKSASEEVKDRVSVWDLTKMEVTHKYDLVLCFETIEHLNPEDTDVAIENLSKLTGDVCIVSTPLCAIEGCHDVDKDGDKSHINIHSKDYWVNMFKKHGFEVLFVGTLNIPRTNGFELGEWELANTFIMRFVA